MDNFMDKIVQKLSAQDVIRANSAADAAQMEKMQSQIAEYESCMKEMRGLNLKNAENEQKLKELLEEGSAKLQVMIADSSNQIQEQLKRNSDDVKRLTEEAIDKIKATEKEGGNNAETEEALIAIQKTAAENIEKIQELFAQSSEFVHKENVKVYRNVQAVVVEELEKQTQALMGSGKNEAKKSSRFFIIGIITMIAALVDAGLLIVHMLGIF